MSDALQREKVRDLVADGLSEADAIRQVYGHTADDPELAGGRSTSRQFVVVTKDFSGLGWAAKLAEEGETVTVATDYDAEEDHAARPKMKVVGKGWLTVLPLSEAIHKLRTDSTYWIFSENYFVKEAEELRKAGQKVFGTSTLSDKLEHDRQFTLDLAEAHGLDVPMSHEFDSREDGLSFLDENHDKAYVFKPDDAHGKNYSTLVPVRKKDEDANREVYEYLAHMEQEPGTYILQERIPIEDAIEANAEVWLYEGEPVLAFLGLEVKRKNTYDIGEMAGCAGDFVQIIPIDCPLVKQTVGKLFEFYATEKYTGFADVNVLFTKDGIPHFLEVCNRFGYNAHPNLFLSLSKESFADLITDFIDGHVDSMPSRFTTDIGASMTLFLDHPREGLPIHITPKHVEQFFPFDGYQEDGSCLLTGYSQEIGIYCARGKTLEAAAKKIWDEIVFEEAVSVPDMHYRSDLWKEDYYNAPVLRYKALQKRKLIP